MSEKAVSASVVNCVQFAFYSYIPFHTCKRNMANDFSAFFTTKCRTLGVNKGARCI